MNSTPTEALGNAVHFDEYSHDHLSANQNSENDSNSSVNNTSNIIDASTEHDHEAEQIHRTNSTRRSSMRLSMDIDLSNQANSSIAATNSNPNIKFNESTTRSFRANPGPVQGLQVILSLLHFS